MHRREKAGLLVIGLLSRARVRKQPRDMHLATQIGRRGTRCEQRIKLAIERPRDKEDGSSDTATWTVVRPFLGSPALSIFSRLKAVEESLRDALFQQQHAGVIAASWVNTLLIDASGQPLNADFTLATRYQFSGVVRVDFSIAAPFGVTRETLASKLGMGRSRCGGRLGRGTGPSSFQRTSAIVSSARA